jgi:acyl-CoA dehydrogenase
VERARYQAAKAERRYLAAFFIVMAVTNRDVSPYKGTSMFLVSRDTRGIEFVRMTRFMGEGPDGMDHPHIRYNDVRVVADGLLGKEGEGFVIAQTRLSGGRIHHSIRAVGQAQFAFDMMCERALSRRSSNCLIADKQMCRRRSPSPTPRSSSSACSSCGRPGRSTRGTATTHEVRRDIATAKMLSAKMMRNVIERAAHIHGAWARLRRCRSRSCGRWCPPTGSGTDLPRPHTSTAAKQILKGYQPSAGLWPTEWIPRNLQAAREKFATALAEQADWEAGNN